MAHKCFQCDQRFKSSGQLVRHMQEAHPSFVQDAKDKIDRSKEQYSHSFVNTAATCPYCQMDCHTRKKLMKHLEEHKDVEPEAEEETELKIIKITNENTKSLLDEFGGEKATSSGVKSNSAVPSTSSPNFVQNLIHALETDPSKIASSKIKVSSTSLKLPEKRYKCFWCDTSFRKRGKLMDHIDMFHKANKDQSELEAELLQGASRDVSAQEVEKPKNSANRQSSNSSASSVNSNNKVSGHKDTTAVRSKSCEKSATQPATAHKPKRKCCSFSMVGTIHESSRAPGSSNLSPINSCKFYFGSVGNLPIIKERLAPKTIESSSTEVTQLNSAQLSRPIKLRSSSVSSSCSQTLSSPQTNAPVPLVPFNVMDTSFQAAAQSFRRASQQLSQLNSPNQPLAQSLFPPMPYYLPASDLYLNQQHNMIMEQQRSQLQYFSYMQSLVSQTAVDPNRPLDLSKANYGN